MSMFLTNLVLGSDDARPSFFEMMAQSHLIGGLRPAFKSLLQAMVLRNHRLSTLGRFDDEAFTALHFFLENHYLSEHDGSFSENFYGLKRVAADGSPLRTSYRYRSLAMLVGFPYLKAKIDEFYERQADPMPEDIDFASRLVSTRVTNG